MRTILSVAAVSLLSGILGAAPPEVPAPATKPDVRITVKAVTAGTDRKGKTAVSSRRLEINLENREHRALSGLQLEWKIVGEDIQSRKKSVDAKGTREVKLDADGKLDIESATAKFTETEGGVKNVSKGNNNAKGKNKRQVVTPDKGRDYAGYLVELKQDGKVIAEASTNGIQKQLK